MLLYLKKEKVNEAANYPFYTCLHNFMGNCCRRRIAWHMLHGQHQSTDQAMSTLVTLSFDTQLKFTMDKKNKKKLTFAGLLKPWIPETIFFFIVLWQESFRLSSRTAHKILPISTPLQNYYYYNFGDFVNGYIIAYITDGVINLIFFKANLYYTIAGLQVSKWKNALLSGIFSILVVVVFEVTQSTSTTSDVKDIPAGALGAFFYCLIRLFALKINTKYASRKN